MKAFPKQCDETIHEKGTKTVIETSQDGMDLRDYFAAKAMAMIPYPVALQEYHTEQFKEYMVKATKCCYQIADAMMEARSK
jgi:galactose-1-phosphate uridylyltransferase